MAEEDPHLQPQQHADRGVGGFQSGLLSGLQGAEAGALQLRIKNSICKTVQSKVDNILQDVEKFTDIEKLYLYLKLPSGPISSGSSEKSDQSAVSSSRTQQMHAFNWIRNHLEEYPETSLPKQEVYDEYKSFCDNLNYHPLSAADFGKMMKNVFPNMKARRLGMRGKSKYCYSGLRKRPFVHFPCLPSLELHKTGEGLQCDGLDSAGHLSSMKEEVRFAACDLVCEWAQKVLKRPFEAVEELARFLMDSHYISNKSLAALTIMTGAATEVKPVQAASAFVPTADAHCFQPQTTTLSSPTVDAKQQLQRKIQRKQQEQKLHSPVPGEGPIKTADDSSRQCGSPVSPSPQPTIGIVVAAVPRPVTTQQSGQLMSASPVGTGESKLLPINFQVVAQPVQPLKQPPKTSQNILPSPVVERTARQRYPQILPKPATTTAIALCSPSTMIIANNPIKTVMTTCHVSPVSLVKMTAISLAPHSGIATTSLTNATLRPASAGISSCTVSEDMLRSRQNTRSTSALPILAPMRRPEQGDAHDIDVEMEVAGIHKNRENQNVSSVMMAQRAASVPIPQTRGFHAMEEASILKYDANVSNMNNTTMNTISLNSAPSCQNMRSISTCNINRGSSIGEGFCASKTFRKRSGLSPAPSPVKRAFLSPHPEEGAANLGYGSRRPESAPVACEMEIKMNSLLPGQVHTLGNASFRASGFFSVAKTQSSMQRKNTCNVMESTVGHPMMQQPEEHMMPDVHSVPNASNSSAGLQHVQPQTYANANPVSGPLDFLDQASTSSQLPMQTEIEYFSFDDDVTQDSIVEELVQMEEQMKLNNKHEFVNNVSLQAQQAVMTRNMIPSNQTMNTFYHAANSSGVGNLVQTPTSEITGAQGLTRESPCSRMTPITPVDSALGSSRHTPVGTPVGTPLSNCSSTVPPSPVECRNPFAFTPINSSITSFHDDNNAVSSSPVKPMQRPTATHPDKTRLDWMSNSYNNNSGSLNESNSTVGILPGYQGLIDDHFQKPHAFAVPHARHHDGRFGRLTPISPVQQQQVAGMAKQEGFAVPAPLDSKAGNLPAAGSFRCRSVSPAVHQRNFAASTGTGGLHNIHQQCVSPFNSPLTPEVLNILANNNQGNLGVSSVAQRSRSVPLNIMMQTEVLPMPGQQCSGKNITDVLLGKMDGDHDAARGLGMNNLPSSYTARMNLTQILESENVGPITPASDSTSTHIPLKPNYLNHEQMFFSSSDSRGQHQQPLTSRHHLGFGGSFRDVQADSSLTAGNDLVQQVSELATGGAEFPCELRMTSDLSGSINDLNTLDANLLFDPSRQQGQYQSAGPEELANQPLFQQITSDTSHSGGLEWLESKDHTTVGLMG
ncbi:DNA-binding protein RFX7-like [Vanacampus margaritifer]